ncbi:class I SAM-dependent methyltransferase [Candidatus Omnitrophota bacterium]
MDGAIPDFDKIWGRDKYLAKINPAQIHRRRLTKHFLNKLRVGPASILDIGCGTGELLNELFSIYPNAQFYGCDTSGKAGKLATAALPSMQFYCFNAEEIPKGTFDKTVDLITCCEVLEHCSSPIELVKNVYQWLNKDGLFFVSVPAGPMTAYDQTIGHRHHFTIQEIRGLLASHGFCDVHAEYWGAPFHTLYRELVRFVSGWNKSKEKIDPNPYLLPYYLCSKVFNLLFYLNFLKSGYQIFGWGIKRANKH